MMLQVNHVHKSFDGSPVLRDISLEVSKGDVIAILGPSGSGKTTLLRCINFLERPDSGTMVFEGKTYDMPTISRAERLRVATMDASTYDFHLSSHGIDPIRFATFDAAMEALRARRVDTVFYDSCSVRVVAEQSGGEFAASRLETRENFGIALGKGHPELKAALDAAIAERGTK